MKIVCQICNEHISNADPLTLHLPMSGAMFASPDPWHGFAPPFPAGTEWLDMKCPYGNHRPFITEDEVLTEDGIYKLPLAPATGPDESAGRIDTALPDKEPEPTESTEVQQGQPFTCSICGREAKSNAGLSAHMRSHQ